MSSMNPIGVISMFYARPFGRADFQVFARIKKAGLDFIELLVPEPGEIDLREARAALADHGLFAVLAARVNLARDLANHESAAHEAGVRYLENCVAAARSLGATIVGGPLYGAPLVFAGRAPAPIGEDERKQRIERVVNGLKKVARRAESEGVCLAVEPLNRFETDIANTTRHGLALVEEVDSSFVGLMLDTFHMNMEDPGIPAAIHQAGSRLIHFQANENHRGFVGSGHLDWPGIARALRDARYVGPITLEPFRRDDERPGIPLAQWRAPLRDEDSKLAASVNYLRTAIAFAGSMA